MILSDLPFLNNTEPMELEDLPLQVALLTMELCALRGRLAKIEEIEDTTDDGR